MNDRKRNPDAGYLYVYEKRNGEIAVEMTGSEAEAFANIMLAIRSLAVRSYLAPAVIIELMRDAMHAVDLSEDMEPVTSQHVVIDADELVKQLKEEKKGGDTDD